VTIDTLVTFGTVFVVMGIYVALVTFALDYWWTR
jgi:hypothetical protein